MKLFVRRKRKNHLKELEGTKGRALVKMPDGGEIVQPLIIAKQMERAGTIKSSDSIKTWKKWEHSN